VKTRFASPCRLPRARRVWRDVYRIDIFSDFTAWPHAPGPDTCPPCSKKKRSIWLETMPTALCRAV